MKRHVRMIQPRFVSMILSGEKLNTIRPTPKREIKPGDIIDFRQWSGKPYRSHQIKVVEVEVEDVSSIEMDYSHVVLRGNHLINWTQLDELNDFAKRDGFKDWFDMRDWFNNTHSLPFEGVIITWKKP